MSRKEQVYHFKEGLLAVKCGVYGREAIHSHLMCYLLGKNMLRPPGENERLSIHPSIPDIRWQKITAGDAHFFKHEELNKGYLYLTYHAPYEQTALLNVSGHLMLYINGIPRAGDMHSYGWMNIPVKLLQGVNEILIHGYQTSIKAKLILNTRKVLMNIEDATVPHVVVGAINRLTASVVVQNLLNKDLKGLTIHCKIGNDTYIQEVVNIAPLTIRKVAFTFEGMNLSERGIYKGTLQLYQDNALLDECVISIFAVNPHEPHNRSFISKIDGSVQYYSVVPQLPNGNANRRTLILSLHGAGVMALNHAKAYKPKNWTTIVAPTNRRPLGYKWEDWGRMDAMEVLEIAKQEFAIEDRKVFLTGHCMGGWGVWYLGAIYPDKWHAIAPCAGYTTPSFRLHRGEKNKLQLTALEEIITRTGNTANLYGLINNYKASGIILTHGDNDETIPVAYSRDMKKRLDPIHTDFKYIEIKGASHWYGDESVDAAHIFDFFKQHLPVKDDEPNELDFSTANIGTSPSLYWLTIVQQKKLFTVSRVKASRDLKERVIKIQTENVSIIEVNLHCFTNNDLIRIIIDHDCINIKITTQKIILHNRHGMWKSVPELPAMFKGPGRIGTFKEAFNHNFLFVYGTSGNEEENNWNYYKARFDAESWHYRSNGSVEILSDKEFLTNPCKNRGIILYGNRDNNAAWAGLLANSPIDVCRGRISIKGIIYEGENFGAYFIRPNNHNSYTSIAVIAATGMQGMRAIEACQYFNYRVHLPDYFIFRLEMLMQGAQGVSTAGFFGNDWSFENGEVVHNNQP